MPRPLAETVANQYGFDLHFIKNDGNCLFAAICDQLHYVNEFPEKYLNLTHLSLRQLAVTHLTENIEIYKNSIGSTIRHDASVPSDYITEYLSNLATPGRWGDQLAILALMAELKFSIAILAEDNSPPIILKSPDPSVPNIYIIHTNEFTHYHALRRVDYQKIWTGINSTILQSQPQEIISFTTLIADALPIFDAPIDSDDEILNTDRDSIFEIDRYALLKYPSLLKIADRKIPFKDVEDLIIDYEVTEIEVLMMRYDWDICAAVISNKPALIFQENESFQTPLYKIALVGCFDAIHSLLNFSEFKRLSEQEKVNCLLDAIRGSLDRGDFSRECKKLESSIQAYFYGIEYGAAALELLPDDEDSILLLEHSHRRISEVHSTYLSNKAIKQDDKVTMTDKVNSCYALFGKYIPSYVKEQNIKLNAAQEFENRKTPPLTSAMGTIFTLKRTNSELAGSMSTQLNKRKRNCP
jgi:hypothetical protein